MKSRYVAMPLTIAERGSVAELAGGDTWGFCGLLTPGMVPTATRAHIAKTNTMAKPAKLLGISAWLHSVKRAAWLRRKQLPGSGAADRAL